jgi:hypothetical protein
MAFGQPGKLAALFYLGALSGGLLAATASDTTWIRIVGGCLSLPALFCLVATGALGELLPAQRQASKSQGNPKSQPPGADES